MVTLNVWMSTVKSPRKVAPKGLIDYCYLS